MSTSAGQSPNLSIAAIALMKGVVYRDTHEQAWQHILRLRPQLADHMAVLGLDVHLDEAEGWAYLRARPDDPDQPLPRLIPRHKLSLPQSLLLALLRKALLEFDATDGVGRLVLSRDRIIADLRTFLADSPNEARLVDQADATISKIVDLGYLRQVKGTSASSAEYEVRRILKAFIDGQWLAEFDARLQEYAVSLGMGSDQGESDDR
ncbi:MAG: DUF4194 domain-containing protein [Austwickia sp.]|nr:DUF4194 domain-containing protein [Austwickia sp.]